MKIIGLNGVYTHDSSAAIVVDGTVVAAVEEERFTHEKHTSAFPAQSVEYCLAEAGISEQEVDVVAVPFQFGLRLSKSLPYTARKLSERRDLSISEGISVEDQIQGLIGALDVEKRFLSSAKAFAQITRERFQKASLEFYPHHSCHAASAYYLSGVSGKSLVFVADLVGEWDTTTIFLADDKSINKKYSLSYPISYGKIYSLITEFLGFSSHSDEYKVMGLAAYGEDRYRQFFDGIFAGDTPNQRPGEAFRVLNYHVGLKPGWSLEIESILGASRSSSGPLEKRHADIANSMQRWLEREVLKHISRSAHENGVKTVCCAGGVCLNAVMNQRIAELDGIETVFVQPASHDAGTALGAALLAHMATTPEIKILPPRTYFLGPDCGSGHTPPEIIGRVKTLSKEPDPRLVAALLNAGMIVAVCRGRAEFGPRALGNRSILAKATDARVKDRINLDIKKREDFRPFAPVILEQFAKEYFVDCEQSPYMTRTFAATRLAMDNIPGAIHVDGTARVQTVNADQNLFLFQVLSEFYRISGVPAILNTSLNLAGDTMALTVEDAWSTFFAGNIDSIVTEDGVFGR